MDDFMEYGKGLVSLPNGWALDVESGNKIDPEGNVFSEIGELIWSPTIMDPDEEYR